VTGTRAGFTEAGFTAGQLATLAAATGAVSVTAATDISWSMASGIQGSVKINGVSRDISDSYSVANLAARLAGFAGVTASMDPVTGHLKLTSASPIVVDDSGITQGSLGWTAADKAAAAAGSATTNQFTVTAGTTATFTFQIGDSSAASDQVTAIISDMGPTSLGLAAVSSAAWTNDDSGRANARSYLNAADTAVAYLTAQRGALGASQNQIAYHLANTETMLLNTQSAVSTIEDADFASAMSDFAKYQILAQSGIAMLTQANQVPQQVLTLLKGL
jgi:flagellin